jgi:hypothetical protein
MRTVQLYGAVLVVWTFLDQWPFRWLAWLWVIVVSLPFLAIVGLGLGLIAGGSALGRAIA